ncbi:sulfite exporter TauE/SafE [Natronocella acetinitrilica]|jgi:uncharacterized protein|uniref:Sulfite exporter TauE/SafE n=1 Tax=Natronocella acetinitrilica TaxID=414046 RepID=A0AAE3G6A1_9GAMM|nr:sulfite exporter TauE/SafE family protein [Natronocella acetinitrilica]MCP1674652.1 sulfite exporter TauE/SafE [Natronocella acetinitrilica]
MTTELTLVAALVIGLAGSTHCLGMCGGIAGSLGAATSTERTGTRLLYATSYNLGRVGSYTLMGVLFASLVGLLGFSLSRPEWGAALRIATGLILLAVAAHLLLDWSGLRRIEVVGGRIWRVLGPIARRLLPVRSMGGALALGALWGWLPCGLVYTVLLAAAVSGDPLIGGGMMLAFGLGTMPAMTGLTVFGQTLRRWLTGTRPRRVLGALLLVFALWTLTVPILHLADGGGHDHHEAHSE